jgi:transglutaminase-like putative cysteine protease
VTLWCTPAQATLPDWLVHARAQVLPSYEPDTEGVVLLDEVEYVVTSPEEYVEHYRRAVKILRPDGRWAGEFDLYYSARDKIVSVHAWSVDKEGREYEVKDKDFEDRSFLSFQLYDDIRVKTAKAPAADVGSVVAFEFEVRRRPWVNQLSDWFQESMPVREARLALELPPGWEYRIWFTGTSPLAPAKVSPTRTEWTAQDLAGIQREPMQPPVVALAAQASLAYFGPGGSGPDAGSWDRIGRWYNGLVAGRRNPTPELSQKAHELTAGKTDFDGKVRALASFLQSDVRYVAIEIGIGGFQPHPASDVFRYRYGDCKDKVTLLSSMLKEVGISSDYVLISTQRGAVQPELPTTQFNHAILAVEIPAGTAIGGYQSLVEGKDRKRYLIFDPTDPYTPVGSLPGELQDTYALLVTDAGGELIHTPLAPPEANQFARSGHFNLSADGVLSGEVVESRTGEFATRERAALMGKNERERTQMLERNLSRALGGFELKKIDIQHLDTLQEKLVIGLQLAAPGYSQARGPLVLLRPRVLGEKGFVLDRKPRRYPFQFESTTQEKDEYEIEIPKEYTVDDVPDPVKVDMGFATYESRVEVMGSKIRYLRELVRKDVNVPAARADDVRRLLGIIGADEAAVVVLKRAQ